MKTYKVQKDGRFTVVRDILRRAGYRPRVEIEVVSLPGTIIIYPALQATGNYIAPHGHRSTQEPRLCLSRAEVAAANIRPGENCKIKHRGSLITVTRVEGE